MNGFELLEILEQQPIDRSKLTIVMLTSSLNPTHKAKAEQLGTILDDFIIKPLSKEAMMTKLLPRINEKSERNRLRV